MALALPFTDTFDTNGPLDPAKYYVSSPVGNTVAVIGNALVMSNLGYYFLSAVPLINPCYSPKISFTLRFSDLSQYSQFNVYFRTYSNGADYSSAGVQLTFDLSSSSLSANVLGGQPQTISPYYLWDPSIYDTTPVSFEIWVNGQDIQIRHWTTTRPDNPVVTMSGAAVSAGGVALQSICPANNSVTIDNLSIVETAQIFSGTLPASGTGSASITGKLATSSSMAGVGDGSLSYVAAPMFTSMMDMTGAGNTAMVPAPGLLGSLGLGGTGSFFGSALQSYSNTIPTAGSGTTAMTSTAVSTSGSLGLSASGGMSFSSDAAVGAGMIPGLPNNVATAAVHGIYLDTSGDPVKGKVSFWAVPAQIDNPDSDQIMVGSPQTFPLSVTGELNARLVATVNPRLVPGTFRYRVVEHWEGGRTYLLNVPGGVTTELSGG